MPMVRAMRLLNSIEAGKTTGTQLQQLLLNPGLLSDFSSIMQLPGQCAVLAGSQTAILAVSQSPLASNVVATSEASNAALASSQSAFEYMQANTPDLLNACIEAFPDNWSGYITFSRGTGAGLNYVDPVTYPAFLTAMVWDGSKFVGIPYQTASRVVYHSTDGRNWTAIPDALPAESGTAWADLQYKNGVFIAIKGGVGSSTLTAYSTDGTTWTTGGALPASARWVSLDGGDIGGTFYWMAICGGGVATTQAAYSTDNGLTWTTSTLPVSNASWAKIVYGNSRFIAFVGNNIWASASSTVNAVSTNGTTFSAGTAFPSSTTWFSLIYASGGWLSIARSGVSYYSTDDGATWTSKGTAGVPYSYVYYLAPENIFAVVTSTGVYYSTSLSGAWVAPTVTANNNAQSLASNARAWAVNSSSIVCATYNTYTGIAVAPRANIQTTGEFNGVWSQYKFAASCGVYANNKYYVFGYGGFYTSEDNGNTWTFNLELKFGGSVSPQTYTPNNVAHDYINNRFLVVCGLGVASTVSFYSNDGVDWTYSAMPSTYVWGGLKFARVGGTYAFIAANCYNITTGTSPSGTYITYSLNGTTWTSISSGVGYNILSIAVANYGLYALTGSALYYRTSLTTGSWSSLTSGVVVSANNSSTTTPTSYNSYYGTTAFSQSSALPVSAIWYVFYNSVLKKFFLTTYLTSNNLYCYTSDASNFNPVRAYNTNLNKPAYFISNSPTGLVLEYANVNGQLGTFAI